MPKSNKNKKTVQRDKAFNRITLTDVTDIGLIRQKVSNNYDYMLKVLMEKADNMEKHLGYTSRNLKTLRKNENELL